MLFMILAPVLVSAQWRPGNVNADARLPSGWISEIIKNIMQWLLAIVGVIGIIGFVIAGIMYFLAAGDDGRMKTAKNAMTYSIIGVIVSLIGYVVIQSVDAMLRAQEVF